MSIVKYLFLILMSVAALSAKAALEALPDEELSQHTGQQSIHFSHFTGTQISQNTTLFSSLIGVDDDHYTPYSFNELNTDGYGDVHFYRIGIKLDTTLNATIGRPGDSTDSENYTGYSGYAQAILDYYQASDNDLETDNNGDGNPDDRILPNWDQVYDARNGITYDPVNPNNNVPSFDCLPHEASCRGLLTNYVDKSNGINGSRPGTYSQPGYDAVNRPNLTTINNPNADPNEADFETSPDYDPTSSTDDGTVLDYDSMSNLDLEGVETSDFYVEFAVKDGKFAAMRTGVGTLHANILRALNLVSTGSQTAILNDIIINGNKLSQFAGQISFNSIGKQAAEVLCQNLVYSSTSDPCGALADAMDLPIKDIDNIDNNGDGNKVDDIIIPYFALVAANASYYSTEDLSEGIKGLWFSNIYQTLTEISSIDCVQCIIRDSDTAKEAFGWYDQTRIGSLGSYTPEIEVCTGRNCTVIQEEEYIADTPTDIDFKGSSLHIKDIPLNLVVD